MSSTRKIVIIFLVIVTLALAGASAYVAYKAQQDTSTEDTKASGFGDTATTDMFPVVREKFGNTNCDYFFTADNASLVGDGITLVKSIDRTLRDSTTGKITTNSPLWCDYELSNGQIISLTIHMYEDMAKVANSQQDVFNEYNGFLLSEIYNTSTFVFDSYFQMTYFFGKFAGEGANTCASVLYHNWNDFGHALIIYTGYESCSEQTAMNESVSNVFSEKINDILIDLYAENGITQENAGEYIKMLGIPIK